MSTTVLNGEIIKTRLPTSEALCRPYKLRTLCNKDCYLQLLPNDTALNLYGRGELHAIFLDFIWRKSEAFCIFSKVSHTVPHRKHCFPAFSSLRTVLLCRSRHIRLRAVVNNKCNNYKCGTDKSYGRQHFMKKDCYKHRIEYRLDSGY